MASKPTLHVVGAAIVRDGRVLAARRSPAMPLPGRWEFPGGKVEDGETPEAALAREIAEELGVTVRVGALVGTGEDEQARRRIRLDVYACELVSGEPKAREHDRLAWVGAGELGGLDWAAADVPVLAPLRALLSA